MQHQKERPSSRCRASQRLARHRSGAAPRLLRASCGRRARRTRGVARCPRIRGAHPTVSYGRSMSQPRSRIKQVAQPVSSNKAPPSCEDGPVELPNGVRVWYRDGKHHREDGPAIIWPSGTKFWFLDGKQHREDGPAVEWPDGGRDWYRDGKLHRDGAPAIEWPGGGRSWYRHGKLHREDGPAIEWPDGERSWYQDGKWHREDGP